MSFIWLEVLAISAILVQYRVRRVHYVDREKVLESCCLLVRFVTMAFI